jgi:hypothetical protein
MRMKMDYAWIFTSAVADYFQVKCPLYKEKASSMNYAKSSER